MPQKSTFSKTKKKNFFNKNLLSQWVRDDIDSEIQLGVDLLIKHDEKALNYFESAEKKWLNLVKTFPRYERSPYFGIYILKTAARSAQILIFHDKIDEAIQKLKESKKEYSKVNKEILKSKETQIIINGLVDDVLQTIYSCGLKASKETAAREAILAFKTSKKGK